MEARREEDSWSCRGRPARAWRGHPALGCFLLFFAFGTDGEKKKREEKSKEKEKKVKEERKERKKKSIEEEIKEEKEASLGAKKEALAEKPKPERKE